MAGIAAFSVPTPEFSPALFAAALWSLMLLHYWRAAGEGRRLYWLAIGFEAGLLLLTTYSGFLLIGALIGFALMFVIAFLIGIFNAFLIRYAKFTPIAATLSLYIGLIGFSFLVRPAPDGYINQDITNLLLKKIGPIPYVFILLIIASLSPTFSSISSTRPSIS